MESLLFLAHRVPYPPNKGDKVRSYHMLRHLARSNRVFLGSFIDDPVDWQHLAKLETWCSEVHVEPIVPWTRRIRSAAAAFGDEAVTLPYFRSSKLDAWVKDVVQRERIERAFAFSSPMAQYLLDLPRLRTIVDFVDLDSAKWNDYAQRKSWPMSAFYRREGRELLAFEKLVAERVEASLFVTREEARLLSAAIPECASRIIAIENGVDSDYFSPEHEFESPFPAQEHAIVFTGTMDYWPNIDAVTWFAHEVLPRIRERDSHARFHIVGMRPERAVQALQGEAVDVTGRVADVRPYLRHACVVVAPMRIARGIQNKVLEAMAMARPVVLTSGAAAALSIQHGVELDVADDAPGFAARVLELMDPARAAAMGRLARERVVADYAWASRLSSIDELLARGVASRRAAAPSGESPRHAAAAVSVR